MSRESYSAFNRRTCPQLHLECRIRNLLVIDKWTRFNVGEEALPQQGAGWAEVVGGWSGRAIGLERGVGRAGRSDRGGRGQVVSRVVRPGPSRPGGQPEWSGRRRRVGVEAGRSSWGRARPSGWGRAGRAVRPGLSGRSGSGRTGAGPGGRPGWRAAGGGLCSAGRSCLGQGGRVHATGEDA